MRIFFCHIHNKNPYVYHSTISFYSEVAEECPLKEKKVEDTKKDEKDEKKDDDTKTVENGDVTVKNGKQEPEEDKGIFQFLRYRLSDILNVFTAIDVG